MVHLLFSREKGDPPTGRPHLGRLLARRQDTFPLSTILLDPHSSPRGGSDPRPRQVETEAPWG